MNEIRGVMRLWLGLALLGFSWLYREGFKNAARLTPTRTLWKRAAAPREFPTLVLT